MARGHTDDLDDHGPEAEERLTHGRAIGCLGLTDAATAEPDRLERRNRAIQIGAEYDQMVDTRDTVGVSGRGPRLAERKLIMPGW